MVRDSNRYSITEHGRYFILVSFYLKYNFNMCKELGSIKKSPVTTIQLVTT